MWARDREGKYTDRLPKKYQIEVSLDGKQWKRVSGSARRDETSVKDTSPSAKTLRLNDKAQAAAIEWLYLTTLSRRPTAEEATEAGEFVAHTTDHRKALNGVLWMLINRSEYLLVR